MGRDAEEEERLCEKRLLLGDLDGDLEVDLALVDGLEKDGRGERGDSVRASVERGRVGVVTVEEEVVGE